MTSALMDNVLLHPELHYGSCGGAVIDCVRPRRGMDGWQRLVRVIIFPTFGHMTVTAQHSSSRTNVMIRSAVHVEASILERVFITFSLIVSSARCEIADHADLLEAITFIFNLQIRIRSDTKLDFWEIGATIRSL